MAPLFGGAAVIYAAAYWLVPTEPLQQLGDLSRGSATADVGVLALLKTIIVLVWATFESLLSTENLLSPLFWVFLYITICVGTHMAPSSKDLENTAEGVGALVGVLIVVNVVAQAFGGIGDRTVLAATAYVIPVVGLLMFAIVLNVGSLIVITIIAAVSSGRRGRTYNPFRLLAAEWGRIAIVSVVTIVFFVAIGSIKPGHLSEGASSPAAVPEQVLLQAPELPKHLCGHDVARPQKVSRDVWADYQCRSRGDVPKRSWPSCLKRSAYTSERGRGCPGKKRCCPPP